MADLSPADEIADLRRQLAAALQRAERAEQRLADAGRHLAHITPTPYRSDTIEGRALTAEHVADQLIAGANGHPIVLEAAGVLRTLAGHLREHCTIEDLTETETPK